MRTRALHKTHRECTKDSFDTVALLLQGGGALGAYQCGVYEALAEADVMPNWIAGISIGAINSAIIAGNDPQHRVAKLRGFWERITDGPANAWLDAAKNTFRGHQMRSQVNKMNAAWALVAGAPGFFTPRVPIPFFSPLGTAESTSWYDTSLLRSTLLEFVDFDLVNHGHLRLSVGAVNVRSGNFVYFDTTTHKIGPDHIMASGALPPGFPAIEIDGEYYWDGGLVSNTPLQWVVDNEPGADVLAFQIDLWSARGPMPSSLPDVAVRQKEIQFSSRTRAGTNVIKQRQVLRAKLSKFLNELPTQLQSGDGYDELRELANDRAYNIVHLIYRSQHYEGDSKDYEFSRLSMEEHWRAGYNDAVRSLRHPEILRHPQNAERLLTFDLHVDGRD
ncbi:MAG: patatin-like phospholipase family protein [Geminicoccaceae bacterium]